MSRCSSRRLARQFKHLDTVYTSSAHFGRRPCTLEVHGRHQTHLPRRRRNRHGRALAPRRPRHTAAAGLRPLRGRRQRGAQPHGATAELVPPRRCRPQPRACRPFRLPAGVGRAPGADGPMAACTTRPTWITSSRSGSRTGTETVFVWVASRRSSRAAKRNPDASRDRGSAAKNGVSELPGEHGRDQDVEPLRRRDETSHRCQRRGDHDETTTSP